MNILRIALRNLARQKKRTILLGGAIAFGVIIITLISSFTRGVTNTASENFTDIFGGQIYITGQELTTSGNQVSVIRDHEVIDEALEYIIEPVKERTYRSRAVGEAIFGSRSTTIAIEGVEWADEPKLIDGLDVVAGSIQSDMTRSTIILPESVANDIGVGVGESILVRLSTVTGQQNVAEFVVEAIIESGSMFGPSSAYIERAVLNPVIGLSTEQYQVLNLALEDPAAADAATNQLLSYLRSIERTEPESKDEGGVAGMRSRMMNIASLMGGGSFRK